MGSELNHRHPWETNTAFGQLRISPQRCPLEPRFHLRLLSCQKGIFFPFPSAVSVGTLRPRFQHRGPGWGAQGEEQQLPQLSRSPGAEEHRCEHSTGLLSRGTLSKRQTETVGKSRE